MVWFHSLKEISNTTTLQLKDSLGLTATKKSKGIGIIFNINTTGNVTFDIFMESSTQTITNGTKKAGLSGGGLGVWALAILLAGLIRRRQIKPRC